MAKRFLLFLIILLPMIAHAQFYFYNDRATGLGFFPGSTTGLVPLPYAQVRICQAPFTNLTPGNCQPLASLLDINGNAISNSIGGAWGQITADVTGRFSFQCPAGNIRIQIAPQFNNIPQADYSATCNVAANSSFPLISSPIPATTGAIRLTKTDQVCWRNNANSADVCQSLNGSDLPTFPTLNVTGATTLNSTLNVTGATTLSTATATTFTGTFVSSSANPASAGFVRGSNTDKMCFRNSANSSNMCLKDSGSQGSFAEGMLMGANDNAIRSGLFLKDANDQVGAVGHDNNRVVNILEYNPAGLLITIGDTSETSGGPTVGEDLAIQSNAIHSQHTGATEAQSGWLRMITGDKICWRNSANSGDDCYSDVKLGEFGASCTTAAAVGAVCNTAITWPSAFADANYTVTCTGEAIASGIPVVIAYTAKAANGGNVTIAALTAAAAQFTTFACVGLHQ